MCGHLQEWAAVEADSIDGGLESSDMQLVSNFQVLVAQSQAITASSALEDSEVVGLQEQVQSVQKLSANLVRCIGELENYAEKLPDILQEAMRNDLQQQLVHLNGYKRQLEVNLAGDPRRPEQEQKFRLVELGAACGAIAEELKIYKQKQEQKKLVAGDIPKIKQLQALHKELSDYGRVLSESKPVAEHTGRAFHRQHNARRFQEEIIQLLSSHGMKKNVATRRVEKYRNLILTRQTWQPIEKDLVYRWQGRPMTVKVL